MLALKELLHNLKDRNWDVNPTYSIDENEAKKIIEALEKTDKWIPCKVRLPEKHGDYLVTIENGDVFNCYFNPDYCYDGYDNGAFTYTQEYFDHETMGSLGSEEFAFDDVVAWMSYEPYKAESEVKE